MDTLGGDVVSLRVKPPRLWTRPCPILLYEAQRCFGYRMICTRLKNVPYVLSGVAKFTAGHTCRQGVVADGYLFIHN